MAAQVSYGQRLQVRTALREAGVNQETVDEIEAGDLDVLYANGWKSKGLILNAQEKHLVESRLSLGAVGVIMGRKQGEPSFLTCFCSWALHGEIVTPQEIVDLFSTQSNESHAYPSRPFIAMSHFISFEPLIVPVSMLLPRCCLALDETF